MERAYKVLLIDDDETLAETYTRLFKRTFGTKVVLSHCHDLPTCTEKVRLSSPDMILLDQKLKGGEDGLDLVDRLRLMCPLTRIVVNSAYGNENLAIAAIRRGVDDFVEGKKENLDALVEAVRRSIEASAELHVLDQAAKEMSKHCMSQDCSEKIRRVIEKHSK